MVFDIPLLEELITACYEVLIPDPATRAIAQSLNPHFKEMLAAESNEVDVVTI